MSIGTVAWKRAQAISRGQVSRPTLLRSHNLFKPSFLAVGAPITFQTDYELDSAYSMVRVGFLNTNAVWSVDGVLLAAPSTLASPWAPLNSVATAVPWVPATFNGGGANVLYNPDLTGAVTTLAMPTTGTFVKPVIAWTDWMILASLPRSDGGSGSLLMIRTLLSTGALFGSYATNIVTGWATPTIRRGRHARAGYRAGDHVTTNVAGFDPPSEDGSGFFPVVQYYGRKRGNTVLLLGDSINQGYSTTSAHFSWGHIATTALRDAGREISFHNGCYEGENTEQIAAWGRSLIDHAHPNVVVIPTYSPNDNAGGPVTRALAEAGWARAMGLAHYAISKQAVPILVTPLPHIYTDAAQDTLLLEISARVRASGLLYADIASVVSDTATPRRLLPAANDDGLHLNNNGHLLAAAVGQQALARAIAA